MSLEVGSTYRPAVTVDPSQYYPKEIAIDLTGGITTFPILSGGSTTVGNVDGAITIRVLNSVEGSTAGDLSLKFSDKVLKQLSLSSEDGSVLLDLSYAPSKRYLINGLLFREERFLDRAHKPSSIKDSQDRVWTLVESNSFTIQGCKKCYDSAREGCG